MQKIVRIFRRYARALAALNLDFLAVTFISILAVFFLWRVVFQGMILLPLDEVLVNEPWRSELPGSVTGPVWNPVITDSIWQAYPLATVANRLRQKGSHFWDPYAMAGLPAMARGDMFSHPLFFILSRFMSNARAMSWSAVLSLALGGIFAYLLLREWGCRAWSAAIGALVFMLNGYLIVWLTLPTITGSMIWLPLVFFGIERAVRRADWRWSLVGALGFALQVLSGAVLWPFYTGVLAVLFSIGRVIALFVRKRNLVAAIRPLLYTGTALSIGAGLVAVQLLLTLQLYLHTNRTGQIGASASISFVSHVLRLFAPDVYGNSLHGGGFYTKYNYAETNLYFGIFASFFILAGLFSARRAVAWTLFAIGAVAMLAVYQVPPFRQLVATVFPVFLNTFPGRIFYLVAFSWSVVAGLGADWLLRHRPRRMLQALASVALVLAVVILILWVIALRIQSGPALVSYVPLFYQLQFVSRQSLLAAIVLLTLAAALFWLWAVSTLPVKFLQTAILLVLTVDLFVAGINFNPAFDEALLYPKTPSLEILQALQADAFGQGRLATVPSGGILFGMAPEAFGLESISGYSSWALKRYVMYVHLTQPEITINHIYLSNCCSPLLNALNARYVYTPAGIALQDSQTLDLIYDGPVKIYENAAALPRAWIVHRTILVAPGDLEAAKAQLLKPDFSPASAAVVESDRLLDLGHEAEATTSAAVTLYSPEKVIVEATLSQEGLLVISDAMYPGWKAFVDGKETPIYYTNLFMRGVFLAPGKHQVEFIYRPDVLPLGLSITLATLAGVTGALAVTHLRRKKTVAVE